MPSTPAIPDRSYRELLLSIQSVLKSGLLAAQKALEYQRVKTYWEIGRRISAAVASSGGKLKVSALLYQDISRDIEQRTSLVLTPDTISRAVQFHKEYPVFPQKTPLTFTHYLALLRVSDAGARARLEQKAVRENWSSPDLKMAVAALNALPVPVQKASGLAVERGEPYVYRVHQCRDIRGNTGLFIDCGFKIDVPAEGMIVQSRIGSVSREPRGVRVVKEGGRYSVRLYKEAPGKLYTYAAAVDKIVDGDTMDVRIDVGFGIRLHDRVRFRGIDCPEISTAEGKLAKKFVAAYLAKCPLVVLRTYQQKEEKYGRWLADIFALEGCADPRKIAVKGELLNQRLLNEGLACLYL